MLNKTKNLPKGLNAGDLVINKLLRGFYKLYEGNVCCTQIVTVNAKKKYKCIMKYLGTKNWTEACLQNFLPVTA